VGKIFSLVRLTRIKCRMFWWTEASISCSNLSAVATNEHADSVSSPTWLQLMGGCEELRELNKYSPDTPRPVPPEDPGAGAASPGAHSLKHQRWCCVPPNPTASSWHHREAGGRHLPPRRWRSPAMCHQHSAPPIPTSSSKGSGMPLGAL
jgi:hypothetical protein